MPDACPLSCFCSQRRFGMGKGREAWTRRLEGLAQVFEQPGGCWRCWAPLQHHEATRAPGSEQDPAVTLHFFSPLIYPNPRRVHGGRWLR